MTAAGQPGRDVKRITPVILSGGAGTRLWPLSRKLSPKQFHSLGGDGTMLQRTAARVDDGAQFAAPVIIAGADHADAVEEQLGGGQAGPPRLILEPLARNTAPAIALAALAAAPDELLAVMPSDHSVDDPAAFAAALGLGAEAAEQGWIVTFGIRPRHPETGYGYIRRGEALGDGIYRVDRFVEKPDHDTAVSYLASGDYDWNGGIFLFRADAMIAALSAHAPDVLDAARAALAAGRRDGNRLHADGAAFAAAPSISIDYAVMERAERIAVVPVDCGWSDVGSWDALWEIGPRDAAGNALRGDVEAIGASNCLIRSEGPVVAAVGVTDLIVVATGDAVLILPRGDSQRVKEAVEALKARGHPALHA